MNDNNPNFVQGDFFWICKAKKQKLCKPLGPKTSRSKRSAFQMTFLASSESGRPRPEMECNSKVLLSCSCQEDKPVQFGGYSCYSWLSFCNGFSDDLD